MGVGQAGHARARRDPLGLVHGCHGGGRMTLRLPDPRLDRKTRGQPLGVGKLPSQGNALGGVSQGVVELAPLVGDLGHAH
jgi:hypothetical protein